ncbi:CLUMA_CG018374, isoform A [Clunio marinus]|uniref:CLUMA_CG018374, isoform A n=1 Tax=Clunio marinus TaxID=568069 RepID=A0A1J1IZL4_9DIPT|nr:CLUMA_CG018374, isoform A [Clunio marinus]
MNFEKETFAEPTNFLNLTQDKCERKNAWLSLRFYSTVCVTHSNMLFTASPVKLTTRKKKSGWNFFHPTPMTLKHLYEEELLKSYEN